MAAVVGGMITGAFMLLQQKRDFARRAHDAVRALLVELQDNRGLVLGMQNRQEFGRLITPDPAWLRRFVWESQLPLIAGCLDPATLQIVAQVYGKMDSIRAFPRADLAYAIGKEQNNLIIFAGEEIDKAILSVRSAIRLPNQARDTSNT